MKASLSRFPKQITVPGWGTCSLTLKISEHGWQIGYMDRVGAFAWLAQDHDPDVAVKNLETYLKSQNINVLPEQSEHKDVWIEVMRWLFLIALGVLLCLKL